MRSLRVAAAVAACVAICAGATSIKYHAAAVMHTPVGIVLGATPPGVIRENLAMYEGYVAKAAKHTPPADIILFPESGTGFLQVPASYVPLFCEPIPPIGSAPSPALGAESCIPGNSSGASHAEFASCAAKRYGLDVVINYCAKDAASGKLFNVDVAVNRSGVVAAVYRKSHITGTGPVLSQPSKPDAVVFHSSFGVTFGMFTCYDFWFLEPQGQELGSGVRDFLFPSEMASGPPVFATVQAVAGWSAGHNVNVVASTSFGTGSTALVSRGNVTAQFGPLPGNFTDAHAVIVGELTSEPPERAAVERELPKPHIPARTGSPTPVKNGTAATCTYGPTGFLNFTFACSVFNPLPSTSFNLVSKQHVDEDTSVECAAWLTTTASVNSSETWVLGAVYVGAKPTVATPSATLTFMCVVFKCNPAAGPCLVDDPRAGWQSELGVADVDVTMQVRDPLVYHTLGTGIYALAAVTNGASGYGPWDAYRLEPFRRTDYTVLNELQFNSLVLRMLSAEGGALERGNLWSFGLYLSHPIGDHNVTHG